jgi:hypothetical protein
VFALKRKADGSIDKFKARLVADGNNQRHGVDFERVFSAVVKTLTIRLVLCIAAACDYNLSSIDIRQAYLQANLSENIYMYPPPGVARVGREREPLVLKLNRSLYGLKQAGREWAALFTSFLVDWGMHRSTIDVCLYTYVCGSIILWVLIYVDDALICDNDVTTRTRFVNDLSKRFPTEDKGELEWILNIKIVRDRAARVLSMSQALHVSDLLQKFEVYAPAKHARTYDTPAEEGLALSSDDQPMIGSREWHDMATFREAYMGIVGGLLWLANNTYIQLTYVTGQLARFMTNPGPSHFKAATRVLHYLRNACDVPLTFKPDTTRTLEIYVDSSWSTRFSCSGALYMYHGCIIHWFSKMQRSVTLSSAEAEFFGAMMAARDAMFVREVLADLELPVSGACIIYSDSKSAIDMAFDPIAFKKTKHILRAAEFLRDLVARLVITFRHLAGAQMPADILTKAVLRAIYNTLMSLITQSGSIE